MEIDPTADKRNGPDRRNRPTSVWDTIVGSGHRLRHRRDGEHQQPYYVDRFPSTTFLLILLLLSLTVLDGILTLILVEADCHEINPAMRYLLDRGPSSFLIGKYILTSAGLPILLIFKNFRLFGTRFRVEYLIPVFVGMYLVLIAHQVLLIRDLKRVPSKEHMAATRQAQATAPESDQSRSTDRLGAATSP